MNQIISDCHHQFVNESGIILLRLSFRTWDPARMLGAGHVPRGTLNFGGNLEYTWNTLGYSEYRMPKISTGAGCPGYRQSRIPSSPAYLSRTLLVPYPTHLEYLQERTPVLHTTALHDELSSLISYRLQSSYGFIISTCRFFRSCVTCTFAYKRSLSIVVLCTYHRGHEESHADAAYGAMMMLHLLHCRFALSFSQL